MRFGYKSTPVFCTVLNQMNHGNQLPTNDYILNSLVIYSFWHQLRHTDGIKILQYWIWIVCQFRDKYLQEWGLFIFVRPTKYLISKIFQNVEDENAEERNVIICIQNNIGSEC